MRLRKFGLAVAVGVGWLINGSVSATQPEAREIASHTASMALGTRSETAPGSISVAANRLADAHVGLVPESGAFDLDTPTGSIHLARAPSRTALDTPPKPVLDLPKTLETSNPEPPRAWLMSIVVLLLIGYQLRRKHRLLRPHRFHQI